MESTRKPLRRSYINRQATRKVSKSISKINAAVENFCWNLPKKSPFQTDHWMVLTFC